MTMNEIRNSEKDILTAYDISEVMGSKPQTIRLSAKQHPELIGYPFAFHGNRMKIPRIGFINWFDGKTKE
ncbi:MAG: hypothetical protein IJ181_03680 [Acidaminococcaceae bacterium]|nr:hypothetical protein [Acidaminococcaceae bacterium]